METLQRLVRGAQAPCLAGFAETVLCYIVDLVDRFTLAGITTGPIFRPVDRWGHVGARALSNLGVARAVKRALTALEVDRRPIAATVSGQGW